jgi:DNA-binding PadR family transcriptional regulator
MRGASEDYLPLTEATFYVMLSMAAERRHGYAILKDVKALSQGRIVLSTGTLYGALSRLLDAGLIECVEEEDAAEVGRPRKFYCLTHRGRRTMEAEVKRMSDLLAAAQPRLAQPEA